MKILIVDNNLDQPWPLGSPFRRYLPEGEIHARRGPQMDLPKDLSSYTHILLSGSKASCNDTAEWVEELGSRIREEAEAGAVVLGVCFGHQIMARAFGGIENVGKSPTPEFGWGEIQTVAQNPILEGLPERFHSFQSHFDEVKSLPGDFIVTARSERCAIQAYTHRKLSLFGIQFHPEKTGEEGEKTIKSRRHELRADCLFNPGRAKSLWSPNVADTIFRNFLRQPSRR